MAKTYKNYIDGNWVNAQTGELFENKNPANTDEVVGRFQKSGLRDVQKGGRVCAQGKKNVAGDPCAQTRRNPLPRG